MKQVVPYATPHFLVDDEGAIFPLLGLLVTDEHIEGSEDGLHTFPVLNMGLIYDGWENDIQGGHGDAIVPFLNRGSWLYEKARNFAVNISGEIEVEADFDAYCEAMGLKIVNF